MPRDWYKGYKEADYGGIPTIIAGNSTRLVPKESVAVIYSNTYSRRYRLVITLIGDSYHAWQWKIWVEPDEDIAKKITNHYATECALITGTDKGTWIDRLRYWLKV